jgi:hypothetical protein
MMAGDVMENLAKLIGAAHKRLHEVDASPLKLTAHPDVKAPATE